MSQSHHSPTDRRPCTWCGKGVYTVGLDYHPECLEVKQLLTERKATHV
jgi:hypothetical protein